LKNDNKLVEGGVSEINRNTKEFLRYEPMKANQNDIIVVKQNINVNEKEKVISKNELESLERQYYETEKMQNEVLKRIKELKKSHKKSHKPKKTKSDKPNSDKSDKPKKDKI